MCACAPVIRIDFTTVVCFPFSFISHQEKYIFNQLISDRKCFFSNRIFFPPVLFLGLVFVFFFNRKLLADIWFTFSYTDPFSYLFCNWTMSILTFFHFLYLQGLSISKMIGFREHSYQKTLVLCNTTTAVW